MNRPLTTLDIPAVNAALFDPHTFGNLSLAATASSIALPVDEQVSLHCSWYPADPEAPLLYYCHDGSGQTAAGLAALALSYNRHGLGFFLASYRGYGQSGGIPSIGCLLSDGTKLFDQALAWLRGNGSRGPVFVVGNGLGTICAIATTLARKKEIKGLLIENGIGEIIPYLQGLGVDTARLGLGDGDGYNTLETIQKIECPTLIFHGARDSRVGTAEAERLQAYSGAKNKQFFIIPGADRVNLVECGGELYYQTVRKFVDGVCGINTWRQKRRQFKNQPHGGQE